MYVCIHKWLIYNIYELSTSKWQKMNVTSIYINLFCFVTFNEHLPKHIQIRLIILSNVIIIINCKCNCKCKCKKNTELYWIFTELYLLYHFHNILVIVISNSFQNYGSVKKETWRLPIKIKFWIWVRFKWANFRGIKTDLFA